jgi:hypothetical protein
LRYVASALSLAAQRLAGESASCSGYTLVSKFRSPSRLLLALRGEAVQAIVNRKTATKENWEFDSGIALSPGDQDFATSSEFPLFEDGHHSIKCIPLKVIFSHLGVKGGRRSDVTLCIDFRIQSSTRENL